jgi:hypothetical protein
MKNNMQLISEATLAVSAQLESTPIAVGALQIAYDYTYNREVLFALCYNGSTKTVRSVYFNLTCMDDAGDTLGELTGECLRGLSAAPGETFGEETPVVLPFRGCARVKLDLQKVVFTDDSVWRIGDAPVEMLTQALENAPVAEESAPDADATASEAPAESTASAPVPTEWLNPPATVEGYRTAAEGLASLDDPTKAYLIQKFTALADKLESEAAEAARKATEAELAAKRDAEYKRLTALTPATADELDAVAEEWKALGNYKDAPKRAAEAAKKAKSLRTSEKRLAQKRAEEERIAAELAAAKRKKHTKAAIWIGSVVAVILAITLFITLVAIPAARYSKYSRTTDLVSEGRYTEALAILEELGDYEDCKQRIKELKKVLTGREDALFFSAEDYPGFTIENGTLSFDSTQYQMTGKKLVIPDYYADQKVTAIAAGSFAKAPNLEKIEIAPTVTTIGQGAFADCTRLTSFEAPGLVTLEAEVFRGCSSLKTVKLPDSLAAIGDHAFQDCTSLTEIDLPENLRRLPDGLFLRCTALKKLTFSSRLTAIGNDTFSYCTSLPSITLPETLESIGNNAFLACTSFTTLTIPDEVTAMGDKAMASCTALTEVKLSANLTKLATRTFSGCQKLSTVTLPAALMQIGYAAFEDCTALQKIHYSGSESDFAKVEILAENGALTADKITFGK